MVGVEKWLSYKGTCHVILLAKLHGMYLYVRHLFHIIHYFKSVSKVAVLHRFHCSFLLCARKLQKAKKQIFKHLYGLYSGILKVTKINCHIYQTLVKMQMFLVMKENIDLLILGFGYFHLFSRNISPSSIQANCSDNV